MCLGACFKIKLASILILTLKNEESGKMSAEGACVWKVGEGESMNPPVFGSPRSPNVYAEYVFVSLNSIIVWNIT